ncbi:MAG TPA: hypothetical protein GX013_03460 [Propionibacterium sp.]|nr:hypothetical protein [Propionibacterium sp.]
MDSIIFLAFAAVYAALLIWGIKLAVKRGKWWTPANIPLLVIAALVGLP